MDTQFAENMSAQAASHWPLGVVLPTRAARYLRDHHGRDALATAVRNGMAAQEQGDGDAAEFWCAVCSTLVRMRQDEAGRPS